MSTQGCEGTEMGKGERRNVMNHGTDEDEALRWGWRKQELHQIVTESEEAEHM